MLHPFQDMNQMAYHASDPDASSPLTYNLTGSIEEALTFGCQYSTRFTLHELVVSIEGDLPYAQPAYVELVRFASPTLVSPGSQAGLMWCNQYYETIDGFRLENCNGSYASLDPYEVVASGTVRPDKPWRWRAASGRGQRPMDVAGGGGYFAVLVDSARTAGLIYCTAKLAL